MDWSVILQSVEQNKTTIMFVLAFCVVYMVVMVFIMKRKKANNNKYLAEHPDAAKVYLQRQLGVTSQIITVSTVNGIPARTFHEGSKVGIYVLPGQSELELEYAYQYHGGGNRTITESTGTVKKTIEAKANGVYMFSFDREEKVFSFARYEQ